MAAVTAEGCSVIRNAAREPEVSELARFLSACGARVSGAGTSIITVEGVRGLSGTDFSVMPDRVEAATFLFAAAATRSELRVGPVVPEHLGSVLQALRRSGCEIEEEALGPEERRRLGAEASGSGRGATGLPLQRSLLLRPPRNLVAVGVSADPYPGFPTDCQPAWCAVIAAASREGEGAGGANGDWGTGLQHALNPGRGVEVRDNVFEGRMSHLKQLRAFGLRASALDGRSAELWPAASGSRPGTLRRDPPPLPHIFPLEIPPTSQAVRSSRLACPA